MIFVSITEIMIHVLILYEINEGLQQNKYLIYNCNKIILNSNWKVLYGSDSNIQQIFSN